MPVPPKRIPSMVEGKLRILTTVPNISGPHLKGMNPKTCHDQKLVPNKVDKVMIIIIVIWASVTSSFPNLI